jgi:ubiquinone/menaquinone biosynthesis C-methylase UbiE
MNGGPQMAKRQIGDNASSTADATTIEVFQRDWAVYRKIVDNNYLFHSQAYERLRRFLVEDVGRPFRFVDVACGDASSTASALKGTKVVAYRGVDFSAAALALATQALAELECPVALEEGDYVERVGDRPNSADVIWIGLSLHHLPKPEKLSFMRKARADLAPDGSLVVYENTSPDGEAPAEWHARWDLQRPAWTTYSDDEWSTLTGHVHAADYPETVQSWHWLGRESGFKSTRELYVAPTDLIRMYAFSL